MCTNYRRTKGFDQVCEEFYETRIPVRFPERHQAPNLEPQPEVRPTNRAVVLRAQEDGVALTWMRWGLIPFFHKGPVSGWKAATFNARAEGVKTAPSFRDAFKRRRCLIAAVPFSHPPDPPLSVGAGAAVAQYLRGGGDRRVRVGGAPGVCVPRLAFPPPVAPLCAPSATAGRSPVQLPAREPTRRPSGSRRRPLCSSSGTRAMTVWRRLTAGPRGASRQRAQLFPLLRHDD